MYKFIIFILLWPIGLNSQDKPVWEALRCDTSFSSVADFNVRSVVLNLLQNDTVAPLFNTTIFWGTKKNNYPLWISINKDISLKNNFLDSISTQYLKVLLDDENVLFKKWQPWLNNDRNGFLEKRNALVHDFSQAYPKLKIKVISDIRTREIQKDILSKGSSLASLSFHEWGLASDFGIYKHQKYLKLPKYYQYLEKFTKKHQLRWGGNFVGFVDYPHIQLYYNAAELMRKHPYLAIEYEYFYNKYLQRVREQIAKNKEFEVEDSKELLIELNKIRSKEKCYALSNPVETVPFSIPENFNDTTDVFIFWDELNNYLYLKTPKNTIQKLKAGVWK